MKRIDLPNHIGHIAFFPETGNFYLTIHGVDREAYDILSKREGTRKVPLDKQNRCLDIEGGKMEVTLFFSDDES